MKSYQLAPQPNAKLIQRIRSRCDEDPIRGCWLYSLSNNSSSYANTIRAAACFGGDGDMIQGSRLVYMALKGLVPNDHQVDHLCRNKLCLNPWHLEAVLPTVNMQRRRIAERHPLSEWWFPSPEVLMPTKVQGLYNDTGATAETWEAA